MAQVEFKITTTPTEIVSSARSLIKEGIAEVTQAFDKPEYKHLGAMLLNMISQRFKIFECPNSGESEQVSEDEQTH